MAAVKKSKTRIKMRSFQGHSIRSNRVINDDYDDEEHTIVTKFREKKGERNVVLVKRLEREHHC